MSASNLGHSPTRTRQPRLSARRGVLLMFLYMSLFGLPQVAFGANFDVWFWLTLFASFILGLVCFRRGSVTLQFYYIFFVFVMMFGYFVQTFVGISYIPSVLRPSAFDLGAFIVFTAHFLGLSIGAILGKGTAPKPLSLPRLPRLFWISGFAVIVVSILLFITVFGPTLLFSARNEIYIYRTGEAAILSKVVKVLPFMFLGFLASRLEGGVVKIGDIIPLLICSVIVVLVSNPITTARYISLTGIVFILAAWLGRTSKSDYLLSFVVIGAYISMILLPATSLLRAGADKINYDALIRVYSSLEFSSIQMVLDGLDFIPRISGSGRQLISDFLTVVPPALYSGGTDSLGPKVAEISGYPFYNAAIPSFMSSYMDGGIIGVITFSIFMGFIMQIAVVRKGLDVRNRRDAYAVIIFACVPILARGDLSTAMSAIYEFSVAYEIFHLVARFRIAKENESLKPVGYHVGRGQRGAYGLDRAGPR